MSGVDGTNLRQMTSMDGPQCDSAQWAPDGQSILFTSTREGSSDLYLLFPRTGEVRRLTTDPAQELEANWSRDGQSIYFGSNRSGRFEIWRMHADGSGATHSHAERRTNGPGIPRSTIPLLRQERIADHDLAPFARWW